MVKRNSRPPKRKKILIVTGIILLVGALVLVALELSSITYLLHDRKAVSGTIPSTSNKKSLPAEKKDASAPSSPAPQPQENPKEGDSPQPPTPTGSAPIAPFGNFVSSHKPSIDGSPTPSSIESVCNTTPGATCRIEFTNTEGVVKKLAVQTTDASGATYWYWDVNQAGLTVGKWKIKVIAELNGQTTIADPAENLEVGP